MVKVTLGFVLCICLLHKYDETPFRLCFSFSRCQSIPGTDRKLCGTSPGLRDFCCEGKFQSDLFLIAGMHRFLHYQGALGLGGLLYFLACHTPPKQLARLVFGRCNVQEKIFPEPQPTVWHRVSLGNTECPGSMVSSQTVWVKQQELLVWQDSNKSQPQSLFGK